MTDKPLNTKALLDTIGSLKAFNLLHVKVEKATVRLRGSSGFDKLEYADKNVPAPSAVVEGVVVAKGKAKIPAWINIVVGKSRIKDSTDELLPEKRDERSYYIPLGDLGWEKEPDVFWGDGYFVDDRLHMDLYCTEYEFPLIQSMLLAFIQNRQQDVIISSVVRSPDYAGALSSNSDPDANRKWRVDGWHQDVFCVSGWSAQFGNSEL